MARSRKLKVWTSAVAIGCLLFLLDDLHAQNEVMGEIHFIGATKVEKTSGVWVDGQYVGYVKELKGPRKVLLLPGEHEVVVRQSGYKDFTQKVLVQPGQKTVVRVIMRQDPQAQLPVAAAQVKISVKPNRAAVFVDDLFAGHVGEFDGPGQAMLVAPGKHRIKIALPGYETFETEISLLPKQKYEVKTELRKGIVTQAGPLIKQK